MDIKFPVKLYASVILLDNKIENWEVSEKKKEDFIIMIKPDRVNDYKVEHLCFVCENEEEYSKVFNELAPNWFKQWKHADRYCFVRAY